MEYVARNDSLVGQTSLDVTSLQRQVPTGRNRTEYVV